MASSPFTLTAETANPPRNSTILITGAGSGIGLATSLYLHEKQYNNNIVALDRNPNAPDVSDLTKSPRYLYISCDVTNWASQRSAFDQAARHFGGLRHVFVNAGLPEVGEQMFTDTFDGDGQLLAPNRATIDVDIRAVGDTLKLAIHHLRADSAVTGGGGDGDSARRGSGRGAGGSIVMTASLAGYLASAGAPLYSAAKHGVVGYLRALKGDCAKVGIAISVVAPGITLTPIILGRREGQSLEDWGRDMAERGVPINNAEVVARVVAHLMGKGQGANGSGMLIQANRVQEIEGGIARTRGRWMGKEMLDLFRGGRDAPLFPNKL